MKTRSRFSARCPIVERLGQVLNDRPLPLRDLVGMKLVLLASSEIVRSPQIASSATLSQKSVPPRTPDLPC